jgi:hypothetical protein
MIRAFFPPGLEQRAQAFDLDGFDEVTGRAEGVGAADIARLFRATEHGDVERGLEAARRQPREHLEPVQAGKLEIQEYEIRTAFPSLQRLVQESDGTFSILYVNKIMRASASPQCGLEKEGVVLGIFDEQDIWTWTLAGHERDGPGKRSA